METGKKIVLLGQFGVGKTSLLRRFVMDDFSTDYKPTLGVQIKKKTITMPSGKKLSMLIWDLEGFSSVSKTRPSYLLGSKAFIYVFDLSRPVTYFNLEEEINYIKSNYPTIYVSVVGNKADIKNHKTVLTYLEQQGIKDVHITSAKTGEGVQGLFTQLAQKL